MDAKRMREFVWYHKYGDCDINGRVLNQYANNMHLSTQDRINLAYFYSITYCVASAAFLLSKRQEIRQDAKAFSLKYKQRLIFTSDRHWCAIGERFELLLIQWIEIIDNHGELLLDGANAQNGTINIRKAINIVEKWYLFSRYSAFLFVETVMALMGLKARGNISIDYGKDIMRFETGIMFVFGFDNLAKKILVEKKLPVTKDDMDKLLHRIQYEVRKKHADDSAVSIETTLCAYAKHFIGKRYNGYYADRQLGELNKLKDRDDMKDICIKMFEARAQSISHEYLGEVGCWNGIRTDLEKQYLRTGKILHMKEGLDIGQY